MIDFSILKNIDFTNTDNLIFLSIFLVIAIIIFLVFIVIVSKIIKIIKRIIIRTFNIDVKKPKLDQKESTDWLRRSQNDEEVKEVNNIPKQKVVIGNDFNRSFNTGEKKSEEKNENIVKFQREKNEKDVAESLSKLKSVGSTNEDTLESKMPSISENQQKDVGNGINGKPKIPIPKHSSMGGVEIKNNDMPIKSTPQGMGSIMKPPDSSVTQNKGNTVDINHNFGQSSDQRIGGAQGLPKATDSSIFGGKEELSRSELRQELKGTGSYQAGKQVGLNLSSIERAKLEKEVFSSALGRNISKTDLKAGIKKLNQKMLGTKDSAEHAKIRKQIKFFKKIGGIKG